MIRAVAAICGLLGGCVPEAAEAFWQPASERAPQLAIESQLIPPAPRSGSTLRVVSYNVEFGADVAGLATALSAPPFDTADVLLIQEIEDHPDEGGSRAARLAALVEAAFVYLPARREGESTHGMAILARREMSDVRFMDLPRFDTSIRTDGRVGLAVAVEGIDVVNVHLRLQLGVAERVAQLDPATRDLAPLTIFGGDFNTNPYAWLDMLPVVATDPISDLDVAAILDEVMIDRGFDAVTATSGPTHSSLAGELRLDSIYSRGLGAAGAPSVERDIELSDHWPLWVDLVLPDARSPQRGDLTHSRRR